VTRRRCLAGVVAAVLTLVAVPAAVAAARPSLMSVEAQLMCTSCHEPLELAQSPQAASEKAYVAGLIAKGLSTKQILNVMVQQYGVAVLGKPPAHGFNLTVYILPPAVLLAGIVFLLVTLPKWRARSRLAAATRLEGPGELDAADAERLDDELARFI
jgi:cytochrome c-type biogenesis protein CcmH/NrfF